MTKFVESNADLPKNLNSDAKQFARAKPLSEAHLGMKAKKTKGPGQMSRSFYGQPRLVRSFKSPQLSPLPGYRSNHAKPFYAVTVTAYVGAKKSSTPSSPRVYGSKYTLHCGRCPAPS